MPGLFERNLQVNFMQYYLNFISRLYKVSGWLKLITCIVCLVPIGPNNLCSQDYLFFNRTDFSIYELQLGYAVCSCDFEPLFSDSEPFGIETFTPEGDVLFFREPPDGAPGLYHVDLLTGDTSLYYAFDPVQIPPFGLDYLVSVGNGMFYAMRWSSLGVDEVWKLDTISGSITSIGHTGLNPWRD